MANRQIVLFRIGCWAAIVTAAVHMFGHVSGPGPAANDTEQQLLDMAGSYQFALPGGGRRALLEMMDGFSLAFATLMVTLGGVGLIVEKRGRGDDLLMRAVARLLAAGTIGVLVISFTHWFIVPTMFLAFVTLCFVLASVPRPEGG